MAIGGWAPLRISARRRLFRGLRSAGGASLVGSSQRLLATGGESEEHNEGKGSGAGIFFHVDAPFFLYK